MKTVNFLAAVVVSTVTFMQPAFGSEQFQPLKRADAPIEGFIKYQTLAAPATGFIIEKSEARLKQVVGYDRGLAYALAAISRHALLGFTGSGGGMSYLPVQSSEIVEHAMDPSAEAKSKGALEAKITEYKFATEFSADKTALRMNIAIREFPPSSKIEIPNSLRVYEVELEGANEALRFSKITKKIQNN